MPIKDIVIHNYYLFINKIWHIQINSLYQILDINPIKNSLN